MRRDVFDGDVFDGDVFDGDVFDGKLLGCELLHRHGGGRRNREVRHRQLLGLRSREIEEQLIGRRERGQVFDLGVNGRRGLLRDVGRDVQLVSDREALHRAEQIVVEGEGRQIAVSVEGLVEHAVELVVCGRGQ